MGRWLNFRLAREQGIAANLRYPLPASFFWDVLNRACCTQKPRSAFAPEVLTFRILRWLEKPDNCRRRGAGAISGRRRRFRRYEHGAAAGGCARPLPDLPPGLAAGVGSKVATAAGAGCAVAGALVARSGRRRRRRSPCRPLARMLQLLQRGEGIERLPQRVSLVGISSPPPVYLELLKLLGQHIDRSVFRPQPVRCRGRYPRCRRAGAPQPGRRSGRFVPDVGNPLLAAWGAQGAIFSPVGGCAAAARCIDELDAARKPCCIACNRMC